MKPIRDIKNVYVSSPDDLLIPHHAEFSKFMSGITELQAIKEYDPIIAGGWPLAVLAAPRTPSGKISSKYFTDYDIYPRDKLTSDLIIHRLKQLSPNQIFKTDNAISFIFPTTNIQVILKEESLGTPTHVILNFDFVNCAIAYTPLDDTVYFHKDLVDAHVSNELHVLHPWMLFDVTEDTLSHVITQLVRFSKYTKRWGYVIAEPSLKVLLKVYKQYPNITITKDKAYRVGSGGIATRATKNQNVWSALSEVLTDNPYWEDSFDIHNKIVGATDKLALPIRTWDTNQDVAVLHSASNNIKIDINPSTDFSTTDIILW